MNALVLPIITCSKCFRSFWITNAADTEDPRQQIICCKNPKCSEFEKKYRMPVTVIDLDPV